MRVKTKQPYQYTPINRDQIRLLTLSPRQNGAVQISIEAKTISDHDVPRYEALSYAWGSLENPTEIEVQDSQTQPRSRLHRLFKRDSATPTTKSMSVTRNLAQALPYLQLDGKSRVLWVDAICINQKDEDEKSQQVQKMATIYAKAEQVLIWLGPADEYTEQAIASLEYLAAQIRVDFGARNMEAAPLAASTWADPMTALPFKETEWRAIAAFLRSPWFERLWVWQEVRLRPENGIVLVGGHTMRWAVLRIAIFCLRRNVGRQALEDVAVNALDLVFRICDDHTAFDLQQLLDFSRKSKCTDPRDRVFALIGLLPPEKNCGIIPEYSKSVRDIYIEAFLKIGLHSKSLRLLQCCNSTAANFNLNLPSWVPDWSIPNHQETLWGRAGYCSSADSVYDGPGTLVACGIEVSTVKSCHPLHVLGVKKPWVEFVSFIFSLLTPATDKHITTPGSELDDLIHSLCGFPLAEEFEPLRTELVEFEYIKQSLLSWYSYLANKQSAFGSTNSAQEEPPITSRDLIFQNDLTFTTSGRNLLRFEDGRIGLGPKATRPGDQCCVIFGCEAPLVLREDTVAADETFAVIGAAYVEGIMHGEALRGPLPSGVRFIERMAPIGSAMPVYFCTETNHYQVEDPRLAHIPLPADWEPFKHDDEQYAQLFIHKPTGEVTIMDPRLFSQELLKRGFDVRMFKLV